jgi:organic hydroperoxide reductase OsmC/OhrA
MQRSATAIWSGGPGSGEGLISTANGAIDKIVYLPRYAPCSGTEICTSPSELLAAAAAASVARWLAHELVQEGVTSHTIRTTATVTAEDTQEGYIIKLIHLDVGAVMEPQNLKALQQAAERARVNSPVCRALNVPVTVGAKLEQVTGAAAA